MAADTQFRVEHIAAPPPGWRVHTITPGPFSDHEVRIAFPPGPRRTGSGKLVSIYHPARENPRHCNPQAMSYLKAAKKAAESGDYIKTVKLLKKYTAKKTVERNRNTGGGDKAAQLYKDFHGQPSSEIIRLQEALLKKGDYVALGSDPEFWLEPVGGDPRFDWPDPDIMFFSRDLVKIATDAKGKHLYIVGRNQKFSPAELKGFENADDGLVNLGEVYGISYTTEKIFDGFKTTTYAHEFGEETGERPELHYDQETARLLLVGGAYHIAGVDKALQASPGIVN